MQGKACFQEKGTCVNTGIALGTFQLSSIAVILGMALFI